MEHLMINDELEKIKGNFRVVEERVDADLAGVLVEGAEGHGAELADADPVGVADGDAFEGDEAEKLVKDFLEIVGVAAGGERVGRDGVFGEVEVRHLLEDGERLFFALDGVADEGLEDRGGRLVEEAMDAEVHLVPFAGDGEVGRFVLVPDDVELFR